MKFLDALRGAAPQVQRNGLSFQDWINAFGQNVLSYPGQWPGYQFTYGKDPAEPIANSFAGYVAGGLQSNGVIFALELKRIQVFSQARFQYQRMRKGRPGDLFGDDSLNSLERPWPGGTTGDMLARMILDADFAGNNWQVPLDDEIVRLRPDWVEIVLQKRMLPLGPDGEDVQVGFKQKGILYYEGGIYAGAEPAVFVAGEYSHFAPIPDPLAAYRGMSWLTPVIRELQADTSATKHKLKFFENAATPNLAVSLPKEITPQQFEAFVEKMDARHKGVDHAYETLYTAGGADVTVIGANLQQLDFKVTQGAGETRLAAAAGIHPVVVALSEGMQGSSLNAGNYTAAKRNTVDTTFRHLWQNAAGSLEPLTPPPAGARLWYDARDIPFLHEDQKDVAQIQQAQASAWRQLVDGGMAPDAATAFIQTNDLSALLGQHSGLYSVQLQPPGPEQGPAGDADPKVSARVARHLPGKHNQETHGRRHGTGGHRVAEVFDELDEFAALDVPEGQHRSDRSATEKVAAGAAKRLVAKWHASDADLERVLREEGAWSHFADKSPTERREGYVRRLLADWNGGSGGPVPVAAITTVADDLGLKYTLSDREQQTNGFIHADPALHRVAESLGRAMYKQTQEWFRERGITHVQAGRASRGAEFDASRPFTSWSLGKGGSAFVTDFSSREKRSEVIPVERIFSIPPTGFGNLEEAELVVLPEPTSRPRVRRSDAPAADEWDDDPIGDLDDDTLILLQAMAELDEEAGVQERAFNPQLHKRYPKGHPLGGKFRPMVDLLKDAIRQHDGKGHPFANFTRPQLVNAAKKRGIALKRGEDKDSIADKLMADLAIGKAKVAHPAAPAKKAPAKKAAAAKAVKVGKAEVPVKQPVVPRTRWEKYHGSLKGIEDIADAVENRKKVHDESLAGGVCGDTRLRQYDNGVEVVYKKDTGFFGFGSKHAADAEQLASVLAQAIGVRAPRIYRNSEDEIHMEFLDNATVAKKADGARVMSVIQSKQGHLVGLLDIMISNHDRHEGNWMLGPHGEPIVIDHGLGFGRIHDRPKDVYRNIAFSSPFASDFSRAMEAGRVDLKQLEQLRRKIQDVRPEFERLGRSDWHDFALTMFDHVIDTAR